MTTAVVRYAAAAVTNRGRKRPSNEDAFGYSVEDGVFVVCDGMGGAAAGEIASSLAVDEVLRLLGDRAQALAENRAQAAPLDETVTQAICAANQAIYSRSVRTPRLSGMGTTLVGLAVVEDRILAFNVGDSRCYRLRHAEPDATGHQDSNGHKTKTVSKVSSRLEQISQDHSLVDEQVRAGFMTRDEAHRSPLRNVITRALGTQNCITPDLFDLQAEPGDLYLLCTDGLTGELDNRLVESILALDLPLDEICARLIKAANKAGGHDNITCLLVRVEA